MTQEEIRHAFEKHLPVTVDLTRSCNPGMYTYTYISALIERYVPRLNENVFQIEVVDVKSNSVMTVAPEQLRLATPREIINL
jgi:hypothetical protein